ncbi:MAG: DUF5916 domain-containing protein [Gemmatimonadota bacterium]|jgi:hypothetical protein
MSMGSLVTRRRVSGPRPNRNGLAGLLLLALAVPAGVRAQAGGVGAADGGPAWPIRVEDVSRPSLEAHHIAGPIRIDGLLDEAAWFEADSADRFITTLPRDGYPPTERTVVRVLYDDEYLYIGAFMYDSQPAKLVSPGLEQDFETHDSDMFGLALDTFLDRQNSILLAVNPAGALFDAQSFNDSREINRTWEGVVETATNVFDNGWAAEMAVPFRTLRFPPGGGPQDWGLNFIRRIRRANEDSYWAPLERQFRVHKMSRAGTLTGLRGLRQGRNLTVKPWLSAADVAGTERIDPGDAGSKFDGGFDLKYGVTSRLTLDVTALTDFSQVEVDQEQVNLTRFSLFFPEKRDFFLENDGIFTLGDVTERNYRTGSSPQDFKLFYSRAIGLSAGRRPIPILGGVRLSGRAGATEVGFLEIQTRDSDQGPAENFAVGRVRQPLGESGDIGLLFTNRQGAGDAWNRSVGVDVNLRLFQYMILNSYLAATDEPDVSGDRVAGYIQAGWRDRIWDASAFVKHVGESFDPGVGFIRRTGMRQAYATVGAHPQPRLPRLQELNPYIEVTGIENVETGRLESRSVKPGLVATFVDGGSFTLSWEDRFERLFDDTEIAGVVVASGDYGFSSATAEYRSNGARALSGTLGVSRGDFYDGHRTSVDARALIRPSTHLALEVFGQRNDLNLGGRGFRADAFGSRLRFAASTRFFASAFVQYVKSTDELVSNIRLNYIHAPLSDVFLVYTERRSLDARSLRERVLTFKITRLLAF